MPAPSPTAPPSPCFGKQRAVLGGELVEVDGEVLEGLAGASHSAPWQKSLFKPSEEELLGLAELHKPFILSGCGGSLSKMATKTESAVGLSTGSLGSRVGNIPEGASAVTGLPGGH